MGLHEGGKEVPLTYLDGEFRNLLAKKYKQAAYDIPASNEVGISISLANSEVEVQTERTSEHARSLSITEKAYVVLLLKRLNGAWKSVQDFYQVSSEHLYTLESAIVTPQHFSFIQWWGFLQRDPRVFSWLSDTDLGAALNRWTKTKARPSEAEARDILRLVRQRFQTSKLLNPDSWEKIDREDLVEMQKSIPLLSRIYLFVGPTLSIEEPDFLSLFFKLREKLENSKAPKKGNQNQAAEQQAVQQGGWDWDDWGNLDNVEKDLNITAEKIYQSYFENGHPKFIQQVINLLETKPKEKKDILLSFWKAKSLSKKLEDLRFELTLKYAFFGNKLSDTEEKELFTNLQLNQGKRYRTKALAWFMILKNPKLITNLRVKNEDDWDNKQTHFNDASLFENEELVLKELRFLFKKYPLLNSFEASEELSLDSGQRDTLIEKLPNLARVYEKAQHIPRFLHLFQQLVLQKSDQELGKVVSTFLSQIQSPHTSTFLKELQLEWIKLTAKQNFKVFDYIDKFPKVLPILENWIKTEPELVTVILESFLIRFGEKTKAELEIPKGQKNLDWVYFWDRNSEHFEENRDAYPSKMAENYRKIRDYFLNSTSIDSRERKILLYRIKITYESILHQVRRKITENCSALLRAAKD